MAHFRFASFRLLVIFVSLRQAVSSFTSGSSSNVAVYWGQNSYGQATGDLAQQRLANYCADTNVDIIPLAFLYQMTTGLGGEPVINFANQGNNCTTFNGTALLDCPQIGDDITTCQQQYNKTILLSIGGATYTEGGFSSEDLANATAKQMWATFGPPATSSSSASNSTVKRQSSAAVDRPFGNATVDGFDFDFETTVNNM
jgi:chitinase